jgi:hypothetical protein
MQGIFMSHYHAVFWLDHAHDKAMVERIVGIETVDQPNDAQVVAYARKYFIAKDKMLSPL